MVIWKDIVDSDEGHQVSNTGLVRSINRTIVDKNGFEKNIKGRNLLGGTYSNGYKFQSMIVNGKRSHKSIHRAVLEAFEPSSIMLDVNHKNGIKYDNRLENLEWMTRSENLKHAVENGLKYNQCAIIRPVILTIGDVITIHKSCKHASNYLGFRDRYVSALLIRFKCDEFYYKGVYFTVLGRGVRC